MILRLLKMRVRPERYADWLRYTRDVGFPGMLAQPGCRSIRRLRGVADREDFRILTEWDSLEDLERFRGSEAMRHLTASAVGLTIPPAEEMVFEVLDVPGR